MAFAQTTVLMNYFHTLTIDFGQCVEKSTEMGDNISLIMYYPESEEGNINQF